MWKLAPLLLLPLMSSAVDGQEQSCGALVDRLSERLGLATESADVPSQSESLTETLKGSGGVIEPPDVGAPAAIEPPAAPDRMRTAPPVEPQAGKQPDGPSTEPAGRRLQIESLLAAARTAAERGDEHDCAMRLAEAEQLAAADDSGDPSPR